MENKKTETENLSLLDNFKILLGASKGFWLINIVNFGDGIAYFGILALLTRFLGTRVGMTDQVTAISVSWFTGLVTLFMFGGGYVSDKLGVRKTLSVALILFVIGRIILVLAPQLAGLSYISSWTGLLLVALGSGILQPALYAGVKEYTDPRTATIGYSLIYSIMNLGIVAEMFVSPFIRTQEVDMFVTKVAGLGWGIEGVFWMCIAITGLMLLIHISLFTKKVELTERVVKEPEESTKAVEKLMSLRLKETVLDFLVKFKELATDARFMFFIFILLPVRTLFAHQFLTMPDYIFRAFPEAVHDKYEWIHALNPFIIVLFVPLFAALTRKAKVIDMMIIGTTVTAATSFILATGPNVTLLLTYVILFSFGEALWSSRFLEYVAGIAPMGKVGLYMGLAGLPWFLAKFTTGFYSGFMLDKFIPAEGAQDPATLWLIYGCIAVISPVGLILGRRYVLSKEKGNNDANGQQS